jgi:dihydroorotate dehydrogenase electron transfer subunit
MIRPACENSSIIRKRHLSDTYYAITFGPFSRTSQCRPGSFLHIRLPGSSIYFRRAMSVAAVDRETRQVEFIFKVLGRGTTLLSQLKRNDSIDILGPLGGDFARPRRSERVVIVAGGVGFPPLLFLATELVAGGFDPGRIEFFYGGRSRADLIERARIRRLGVNFHPCTDDGSFGRKGLVTEHVEAYLNQFGRTRRRLYACGPEPMLKAVNQLGLDYDVPGQLSLEAPMPCGIGVCLGCVVPLARGGYARVCADGPVFDIGEVIL